MSLRLRIDDMTCGHCVARITQAAQAVDPHAELETDLATHTVHIKGSGAAQDYERAIREAGFTPVALPA